VTINFSIYTDTVLRGYRDLSERANELNRHQHLPDSRDKVHRGKRRRICDAILRAGGVATRSTASPLKIIPPLRIGVDYLRPTCGWVKSLSFSLVSNWPGLSDVDWMVGQFEAVRRCRSELETITVADYPQGGTPIY